MWKFGEMAFYENEPVIVLFWSEDAFEWTAHITTGWHAEERVYAKPATVVVMCLDVCPVGSRPIGYVYHVEPDELRSE